MVSTIPMKQAIQGRTLISADGFYNPHSWTAYDPNNANAHVPAPFLTVDTHQFWAFPPLNNLSKPEVLEQLCAFGQTIKAPGSGIPPTLVGEWSLDTGQCNTSKLIHHHTLTDQPGITANSTSDTATDVDKRTWFRQLFEAQNAAFTPNAANQSSIGWYFWAWQTEYDIDAWSYRKGVTEGYIPSNVSDPSTYVFPIKANGCIDTTFDYTAPATVNSTITTPSSTSSSSAASGTGSSKSTHTPKSKSGASSVYMDHWQVPAVLLAAASIILFSV